MQGGHMGTHGHEGVPIPEVEAGRGVPGVDLWLGGGGGWFNHGLGFGAGFLLVRVGTGGFSVCTFVLVNKRMSQPTNTSAGLSYARNSLFHF